MKPILKDDRKDRKRNRQRGIRDLKIWLLLTFLGAVFATIFGNWNSPDTVNVFMFYSGGTALLTKTISNVVAIWKRRSKE